jgi:hypothetical protein
MEVYMHEVELVTPNRLNLGGVVYVKGIKKPVKKEVALALSARKNFRVYGLSEEEVKAHREDEIRPRGVDLGEAIRDAIAQLESVDPENYNRDGLPALHALSDFLGYQVTAEQRARAIAHEDEKEAKAAAEAAAAPKSGSEPQPEQPKRQVRFAKPTPADAEQKVAV